MNRFTEWCVNTCIICGTALIVTATAIVIFGIVALVMSALS